MMRMWNSSKTEDKDVVHGGEYYNGSSRLATCMSDHSINIYDTTQGTRRKTLVTNLKGHSGPILKILWAHYGYRSFMASCSDDSKVIIWKENDDEWEKYFEYGGHDSSVNSVAWAESLFGLRLACASLDGSISILTHVPEDKTFKVQRIMGAHENGCTAVFWGPSSDTDRNPAITPGQSKKFSIRLASGGKDWLIKVWKEEDDQWLAESKMEVPFDSVRDVAWASKSRSRKQTIASCSEDRRVIISSSDDYITWKSVILPVCDYPIREICWTENCGVVLAVKGYGANSPVTMWHIGDEGMWEMYQRGIVWYLTNELSYVTNSDLIITLVFGIAVLMVLFGLCFSILNTFM